MLKPNYKKDKEDLFSFSESEKKLIKESLNKNKKLFKELSNM